MRKVISLFFGLIFLLFAAFQYNDPDPAVWISIYGLAALLSFYALASGARPVVYVVAGIVFIGAAIYWWPPAFEGFLLDEMGMKTINIELARESGGLGICALAMFILAALTRNRTR